MGNYINGTYVNGREIIVNGNGYEFKNGKWRRTIRAYRILY